MKQFTQLLVAVFILLHAQNTFAQFLMNGTFPGASESLLGTRFRNVRNVNANQSQGIFTGIPDLGANRGMGTRSDASVNYGNAGSFSFSITYNVAANALTTTVTNAAGVVFTNTLTNISDRTAADGKVNQPNLVNLMRLTVRTQTGNSSIEVSNLNIDGFPVSGTYGRSNDNGSSDWFVTSSLLNNGFTVTGRVSATGNFSNSAEGQRIEFGFGYTPTPGAGLLPVTWGEVAARQTNNVNRISWTTLQESNTSHFDVQRSTDGVNYTTIGTVTAAGNASTVSKYQFDDMHAPAGKTSFYRLLQVDLDGRKEFSMVVKISAAQATSSSRIMVSNNLVRLSFSDASDRIIRLLDMNGRMIRQLRSASNQLDVPSGDLQQGMYVLVVIKGGNQSETHRFIK